MESRPTYTTPVARASTPASLHGGYGKPPYICDTRSAGFHTRAPARRLWKAALPHITSRCTGSHTHAPARRLWKAALHIRHPLHGLPHPRTAAMESRPTPYYIPLHGLPYPRACTAAMESRPTYTTPVARASTPAHGAYGKPPYIYDTRCTGSHTHCTAAMESRPTYTTPVARVPIPTARRLWKAALPHITSRSAGFHTHAPARRLWKAALHIRHPLHGLPHPRTAAMESRPTSHERRGRARSSVSRINVTGPSLWISTSMCAWKRPSSTRTPRPRSA